MLSFYGTHVYGWEAAFKSMRNPLQNHKESDSDFRSSSDIIIGSKDIDLAKRLVEAGDSHAKFTRMITVATNIQAPLYWWKQFDTYKIGVTTNSESSRHTLANKLLTKEDFSLEIFEELEGKEAVDKIIRQINRMQDAYQNTKSKKYIDALIQILPDSYNQHRTVGTNYQTLRRIYKDRKDHPLAEWHTFCNWLLCLPYASQLITK